EKRAVPFGEDGLLRRDSGWEGAGVDGAALISHRGCIFCRCVAEQDGCSMSNSHPSVGIRFNRPARVIASSICGCPAKSEVGPRGVTGGSAWESNPPNMPLSTCHRF